MMIGDLLRAERERQNLSIKDVERGTSIRSLYIEAIEKGEYKTLPGEVYTKGFIRNYANFLKLDADAAVKQFNEERHPDHPVAESGAQRPLQAEPAAGKTTTSPVPELHHENDFVQRVESSHHRQTLIMGVVAVLVVLAGAYFLLGGDDEPQPAKTQPSVTQQASKTSAKQQAQQPSEEEKATEVKVAVKFTGRCWVSVKADGKTLFEGTVEKGETKEWTADQRLDLTAGNAGAVTLSYNGEDQGVLGKEGEVVEKTYRLDGAADAVDATAEKSAAKKKK